MLFLMVMVWGFSDEDPVGLRQFSDQPVDVGQESSAGGTVVWVVPVVDRSYVDSNKLLIMTVSPIVALR